MALNIKVNGTNKNAFARYRTLRIQKDGPIETCRIEFLDHDVTAAAFRVVPGDELHVDRNGISLEFGGEVTRVTDQRLSGLDNPSGVTPGQRGGGTVTVVESRGWYFEAADIKLPLLILPAGFLLSTAEALRSRYLDAKGWTPAVAITGGPAHPLLVYTNTTLADVFDDLTKKYGWPWRVNGDRGWGFVEIGSLVAPHTYDNTNSIVLRGATWTQERVRRATRLFITSGGSGQYVYHYEDHAVDGVKTHFPINVLPIEPVAAVNNAAGYAAAATTMAVDGLPKSYTIKAGVTFRFGGHGLYTLTGDATSDADGAASFSFTPGLSEAVVDDQSLTLDASALVTLEVGGTPTDLDGSPWSFDVEQAMFVTSGSAPSSGYVRYKKLINYPAVVRVWDPTAQLADGSFDYQVIKDGDLTWPDEADLAQVAAAGRTEVSYRVAEPKELQLATFAQDVYPWMLAPCSFPERLISGDYMVQRVVLTDVGKKDQDPRVELTLLEGNAIGRNWRAFWMGKDSGAAFTTEDPCGTTPSNLILSVNFSPGASSAFVVSGAASHWEVAPGGAYSPDANYPGLFAAEDVRVVSGGGPAGENYLTKATALGADWVNGAAAWRGLGDSGARFSGLTSDADAWNAARGRLTFDMRFDADALNHAYNHILFQMEGEGGPNIYLQLWTPGTPTGPSVSMRLYYYSAAGGEIYEQITSTAKADLVAEGWKRWRVCYKCGTYNWDGVTDPVVASDGWLKVWRGDVLMFSLTGIDLLVGNGASDAVGTDFSNYMRMFAVGYYGLAGDVTNIDLRCEGPVSAEVPQIIQTATKIGEDGDSTNAVALDSPISVTAGDTIIVEVTVWNYAIATPGTVSDGVNTYALVSQVGNDTDHHAGTRIYKATAASTGSVTPQYTPAVTEWVSIGVVHVRGTTTVETYANVSTGAGVGGSFGVTLSATTVPNCLILGFFANNNGDSTFIAHSGWTLKYLADPGNDQATVCCISRSGLPPAVYSPTWDAASSYACHIVGIALAAAP